jgi:hypothetical protein
MLCFFYAQKMGCLYYVAAIRAAEDICYRKAEHRHSRTHVKPAKGSNALASYSPSDGQQGAWGRLKCAVLCNP